MINKNRFNQNAKPRAYLICMQMFTSGCVLTCENERLPPSNRLKYCSNTTDLMTMMIVIAVAVSLISFFSLHVGLSRSMRDHIYIVIAVRVMEQQAKKAHKENSVFDVIVMNTVHTYARSNLVEEKRHLLMCIPIESCASITYHTIAYRIAYAVPYCTRHACTMTLFTQENT